MRPLSLLLRLSLARSNKARKSRLYSEESSSLLVNPGVSRTISRADGPILVMRGKLSWMAFLFYI